MYPIPNFSPEVWEGSLAWTLSSRALPRDGPDRRSRSARSTLSSNSFFEVHSTGPVAQVARAHP